MKNLFKYFKTTLKENELKTFHYELEFFNVEIDEIKINNKIEYVIAKCNVKYWTNIIDSRAKTKKTLLNRLDKLFEDI